MDYFERSRQQKRHTVITLDKISEGGGRLGH
jgi:hypothetical protein